MIVSHHSLFSRYHLIVFLIPSSKFGLRKPSKFVVDLCRIDRITHIMSLTVCNVSDQAFRFSKLFTDDLNDLDVRLFVVSTYVVYFSDSSVMDDQIDCPCSDLLHITSHVHLILLRIPEAACHSVHWRSSAESVSPGSDMVRSCWSIC